MIHTYDTHHFKGYSGMSLVHLDGERSLNTLDLIIR